MQYIKRCYGIMSKIMCQNRIYQNINGKYGFLSWASARLIVMVFIFIGLSPAVMAEDLTQDFDTKHKACLERIAIDSELAYEEALIWKSQGGGRRAKHCIAMALFALGQPDEAAFKLDKLAQASDGGTDIMRADFYFEATNFWLDAKNPKQAYQSATKGLDLIYDHQDLRIARARAYVMAGRYDYAQTDLTSVLTLSPNRIDALRYRADTHLKQGNLQAAKIDIEKALSLDPTIIETALVRGHINEAIRKAETKKTDQKANDAP